MRLIHKISRYLPVDEGLMACLMALVVWQKIRQQPFSWRSAGQLCFHLLAGGMLWILFLTPAKPDLDIPFPPVAVRLLRMGREILMVVFLLLMGYLNHALPLVVHSQRTPAIRRDTSSPTLPWYHRLFYTWFRRIALSIRYLLGQPFCAFPVRMSGHCPLYLSNRVLRR